jgi:hypothetical protein
MFSKVWVGIDRLLALLEKKRISRSISDPCMHWHTNVLHSQNPVHFNYLAFLLLCGLEHEYLMVGAGAL